MNKLRLRYVQAFRVGTAIYYYFRRRGMPRVALPGMVGSAGFMEAYQQALDAAPVPIGAKRNKPGSVSAAIAQYFGSQAFRSLTGETPAARRRRLEKFREKYGERQLASLPKDFVIEWLDTMPPFAARQWLVAFRHFIRWCETRKLIRSDMTLGIRVKAPKTDGHHTWDEDEVAKFEAHHSVGSKPRLAFALGIYTAQRRGDVIRIGRQHIRDSVLTVRQQKTGVTLAIPVHPELEKIIAATPIGHLTLLTTVTGKSYNPNDFTDQFRVWCDEARLPRRCVFHGLRKAACRRLAELGCSVHEIASISGHRTLQEVERYTKAADQTRLAKTAMARMVAGEQSEPQSVKPEPFRVSKPLKALA